MLKLKIQVNRHVALDGEAYASFCPEFCVASSGLTKKEALENLDEALDALFEMAHPNEILHRLTRDITEYLEIWELTARKDEFDKSRQTPAHLANGTDKCRQFYRPSRSRFLTQIPLDMGTAHPLY